MQQSICTEGKVYFGTGLASFREEGCGFGFELLNMVLTALILTKKLGATGVFHDIATVGYNISEENQKKLINEQQEIISNMINSLKLKDIYNFKFSHCYHDYDIFKSVLQEVKSKMCALCLLPDFQNYKNYTILQIAQMKFLYETENARIKLGWNIGNNPTLEKVDFDNAVKIIKQGRLSEYFFDSLYLYAFPEDNLSFIYTTAGIDIINGKKYAPYTVTKSQNRPLLTQPIKQYLQNVPDSPYKRKALKLYEETIVHNWEHLFGKIETENLPDKLQYIQDRVLGIN